MKETIARYRDLLVARLGVIEEEIRLAEAHYRERKGDYRYVILENTAIIERQLHDIGRLRTRFRDMDIDQFDTIDEFKSIVLTDLQTLYDGRPILRSGLRIVMECIREL